MLQNKIIFFLFFSLVTTIAQAKEVVNIYTYRQPELIQPVIDAFQKETGILAQILFLDKGLEERVLAEGRNSPVDVIMTVDISRLTKAKQKGITQPLQDASINQNIPLRYRDPEGHWFALTKRARVVYMAKERSVIEKITYEELAHPSWKGKICIRSGQHDYNIALFSAAIAHWGVAKTEKWMQGLKKNLARKPQGGDRLQAKAVAVGQCDIALGNTYYIALMNNEPEGSSEKKLGNQIKILFPTFENGKTHINISGVALAKHSPNLANAIKLIRFLSEKKAQKIYAEKNFEYPVSDDSEISPQVKELGELKADSLPLIEIAKYRQKASEMIDKIGFDHGPEN